MSETITSVTYQRFGGGKMPVCVEFSSGRQWAGKLNMDDIDLLFVAAMNDIDVSNSQPPPRSTTQSHD